jgi:fructokinase
MRWGIDLGGTKIECAVLTDSGEIIERQRLPTESEYGYDHVLRQIEKLVARVSGKVGSGPGRLGIGTPGSIDQATGLLKNCNAQSLNNHPMESDISRLLGIPVVIANDANCFTLAEYYLGSVAKESLSGEVVFGVILGTGVGGGLIINGKVHNGRNSLGGEFGHAVLNPNGSECYCGKKGCVETYISGTSLQSFYMMQAGQRRSLEEIYDRYKRGNDIIAEETIDRLVKYFGLAISNIVNTIDPDVIVLGGGVSNIPILYNEGIHEVRKNVFGDWIQTPILKADLGDSAGVFGAAYLGDVRDNCK